MMYVMESSRKSVDTMEMPCLLHVLALWRHELNYSHKELNNRKVVMVDEYKRLWNCKEKRI
jgi:hypothetical protein